MRKVVKAQERRSDVGSLYSFVKTGVAISRDDVGILACNANYADILDREPQSVLGLGMEDITHPDDVGSNAWLLQSARSEGRAFDIRKRYVLPSGRSRWVENHVVTFDPKDGVTLVLSREIAPPCTPSACEDLREYIGDMAAQLAEMARRGGLMSTAEALELGALLSEEEGSNA